MCKPEAMIAAAPAPARHALPLDSGIQAGNSKRAVEGGVGRIHLPYDLWIRIGGNLEYSRIPIVNCTGIELHISVRQYPNASSPKGEKSRGVLPRYGSGACRLIHVKDYGAAVTGIVYRTILAAAVRPYIAVIVHAKTKLGALCLQNHGKMLVVEPLGGIVSPKV